MSGGMPYQLEKGPYFSITEALLNVDAPARLALLLSMLTSEHLRTGPDQQQTSAYLSSSLDAGGAPTVDDRREHMGRDWFGWRPTGQPPPNDYAPPQQPFVNDETNPDHNPTTGYWHNWYGDAEGIVAQTFIRAIEVSLGLEHGRVTHETTESALQAIQPPRCDPIEVFWRCPAPWMEGWVTWRHEADPPTQWWERWLPKPPPRGHVTVHVHTPGHVGSALLLSPVRPEPYSTRPDYLNDPTSSDSPRGMWVIAHHDQVQHPTYGPVSSPIGGEFPLPTLGPLVESTGPIVTVRPSESDGGVLRAGR